MKQILVLFCISILFINCTKEESNQTTQTAFVCFGSELDIITDQECCDTEPNSSICEILKVEEVNRIDPQNYSWVPNECSDLNSEIIFKSNFGQETRFTLVDRNHFVLHEKLRLPCNEDYHRSTYIEQKNETIELAYLNKLFGSDTLYIKLRSIINSYENQTPNPKVDLYSMLHRKSNTNITNFYYLLEVNDLELEFDHNSRTFHELIELNGEEYTSVVEFKVRSNVHAEPHTRIYINEQFGFFGFEKDKIVWTKEI
jgi:hypothetical protein